MQTVLSGKRILIVKGSLLAPWTIEEALAERGAKVVTATNIISAFTLIEKDEFDAAVIDKGLHNEAFDLCAELKLMGIPHVLANEPHELQKPFAQIGSAVSVVGAIEECLRAKDSAPAGLEPVFTSGRYPAARGMGTMAVFDPERF